MNVIRSHCHDIYTEEFNKIALSSDDDKRIIIIIIIITNNLLRAAKSQPCRRIRGSVLWLTKYTL